MGELTFEKIIQDRTSFLELPEEDQNAVIEQTKQEDTLYQQLSPEEQEEVMGMVRPSTTPIRMRDEYMRGMDPPEKFGEMVRNIPESAKREMVDPIMQMAQDPEGTKEGLKGLASGTWHKLIGVQHKDERYFDAVIDDYKDSYGSWEEFENTLINDPVRVMMDVSMGLMGFGFGTKIVGQGARVAPLVKAGEKIGKAGRMLEPTYAGPRAMKEMARFNQARGELNFTGSKIVPELAEMRKQWSRKRWLSGVQPSKKLAPTVESQHALADKGLVRGVVPTEQNRLKLMKQHEALRSRIAPLFHDHPNISTEDLLRGLDDIEADWAKGAYGQEGKLLEIDAVRDKVRELGKDYISTREADKLRKSIDRDVIFAAQGWGDQPKAVSEVGKRAMKNVRAKIREKLEAQAPQLKALNAEDADVIKLLDAVSEHLQTANVGGALESSNMIYLIGNVPYLNARMGIVLHKSRQAALNNPRAAYKLGIFKAGQTTTLYGGDEE